MEAVGFTIEQKGNDSGSGNTNGTIVALILSGLKMEYTIYSADGSFLMNVTCSAESLADMLPVGGYSVEGTQSTLSTCVGGHVIDPNRCRG